MSRSDIGRLSEIRYECEVLDVEWEITDYFSLSQKTDVYFESPHFRSSNASWYLTIYPNGARDKDSTGYLGLYLMLHTGKVISAKYTMGLKALSGEEVETNYEYIFGKEDHGFGTPEFLPRSDLYRRKNDLVPLGSLTVFCSLREKSQKFADASSLSTIPTVTASSSRTEASTQTDAADDSKKSEEVETDYGPGIEASTQTDAVTDSKKSEEVETDYGPGIEASTQTDAVTDSKTPDTTKADYRPCNEVSAKTDAVISVRKLQHDLEKLLLSESNSDAILDVQGKEFRVHRNLIGARSPVFAAMMEHEMKEKSTGVVCIDDLNSETFPDFLNYLYTGNDDKVNLQNVLDLYTAADKYQVEELKMVCLDVMVNNICMENFCDLLTLSLRHQEKELTDVATDFFLRNANKIVLTTKWQAFISENPIAGNELFIKHLTRQ